MLETSNGFFKFLGLPYDQAELEKRDPYREVSDRASRWRWKMFDEDEHRDGVKRLYVRHAIRFDDQKANHDRFFDRCWLVLRHSICREWYVFRLWVLAELVT